jgi:methionine sulfoxide reductase heme-binding subunit
MSVQPAVQPAALPPRRTTSAVFRLSGRSTVILGVVLALAVVYATDQVVPATSDRQAQLRIWLAARAAGIAAYLLLSFQVALGLVLSHPTNKSTWKLSKRLFPWHEHLWVFVTAFLAVHVASIVADPYAGVGLAGALVPGLSAYRSPAVAVGTLSLYAFLLTALTARWTRRLPPGAWLSIHRVAIAVWVLAWLHGVLAGSDSEPLAIAYVSTGIAVIAAAAYRYWVSRLGRPSFETRRLETDR